MATDPGGSTVQQRRQERDAHRRATALAQQTVDATAGGGLVRVRVDGHGRVRSLEIAPEAFAGRDPDLLADLIMGALAEGQRRADALALGGDAVTDDERQGR